MKESGQRDSVRFHAQLVLQGKVRTHATRCGKLCARVCVQLITNIMFCFETTYLCLLDVQPSCGTSSELWCASDNDFRLCSSESSAENINNDNSAIYTNMVHNSHGTS